MPIATTSIRCSFCLKPAPDVDKIISGPGVYICDECVGACVHILESEGAPDDLDEPRLPRWQSMEDEELLKALPLIESVATQAQRSLQRWVREGRRRGMSWAHIGAALGISRQSAWERFARDENDD